MQNRRAKNNSKNNVFYQFCESFEGFGSRIVHCKGCGVTLHLCV